MKRPRVRRVQPRLLICSFLIAAGVVLAVVGVLHSQTGKSAEKLPVLIESVDPVPNAMSVPDQTRIFVDLAAGYTGELVIDGLRLTTVSEDTLRNVLPGQQTLPTAAALTTVYAEGNATLTFVPTKGAPIESLTQGRHIVSVIYWKIVDGPEASQQFQWTFSVF